MTGGEGKGDTVLRVHRSRNHTAPLDAVAQDEDLSWKGVGLLTYLVTRPDGWEFYKADLIARHSDGKTAVESGLRELREAGYLEMEQTRTRGGTFRTRWTVSDHPLKAENDDRTGKSGPDRTGFSAPDYPHPENRGTDTTQDEEEGDEEETEVGGSSLRSSPPEGSEESTGDGEDDDTPDPLSDLVAWIRATPASENAPTAHWVDGVRALWWGADDDPFERGVGATMRYLTTEVRSHGGSHMDGSRFIVGCALLRERGDLMGLDPGEPFGRGLLLEHDKQDGRLIWGRALDAARELEEPDEGDTNEVLEQVGLELDGADEEVDRVPA